MDEIRKEKIKQAVHETSEIFDKLELNNAEIEIVTRSGNIAARVQMIQEENTKEAWEYIEKKQMKTKDKIVKYSPAFISMIAIAMSIASILIRLLQL